MSSVFITGIGIVSALGIGVEAQREKLVAGKSGLKSAVFLNSIHSNTFPFGEVPYSTEQLFSLIPVNTKLQQSRLQALAALALAECFTYCSPVGTSIRQGLVNATTVGGMTDIEDRYFELILPENQEANTDWASGLDCATGTEHLARQFGLTDFMTTVSTACSSSANAIQYGARLLQQGILDRVVCGGVDSLTRFTVNGFNSLKNLDKEACKPFDANRNGLNLGEGAAYLLLETEASLQQSGNRPLAVLSGYANFNEAFHPTAPSPEGLGAFEAMKRAIEKAGLLPADISYINAHGTATLNNDESEGQAIRRLFGEHVPPFSSTKVYTGHTLAAAGAIEAVFSILSLQHQEIYPGLPFHTPMPTINLVPVKDFRQLQLKHILSNSFGFGGNNASLVFSNYD
ncbi:beta-ketoacyl-[acyl-carrier-protein] synthase family protein [Flavihumibacter sp. CACIAM 22H1]|uniref:beta-ketoacyl-[acyl-carrier-protein] synthase family protein n=1 Tax=Flavihumibacter sp. CACIAM 22H1 TaxID=1812911 RepID=UPI0007A87260|nr:beta-ketoacyl-[acyl-carrier-protein] synthase family protein [Flavihumibacter sp. CACIAM 22H1]KYP13980.1 MAG: hypothetical protein A1D16_16260 [Flavihumibacter sp. CACIAM 22H1]